MKSSVKKEIRIIAWDDCAFSFRSRQVSIIGAIFRGGQFLDGLLSTTIKKDGMDVTDKTVKSIKSSRHYDQLSVIMLNGITFGGFNLIDIKKLNRETRLPVLVIQRKKPDIEKFNKALNIFDDQKKRKEIVKRAGKIYKFRKIHYQKCGLKKQACENLLKLTCIRSDIPEPIRVAHLIASGLSRKKYIKENDARLFESRGRA